MMVDAIVATTSRWGVCVGAEIVGDAERFGEKGEIRIRDLVLGT
jgi:hypothetical protein